MWSSLSSRCFSLNIWWHWLWEYQPCSGSAVRKPAPNGHHSSRELARKIPSVRVGAFCRSPASSSSNTTAVCSTSPSTTSPPHTSWRSCQSPWAPAQACTHLSPVTIATHLSPRQSAITTFQARASLIHIVPQRRPFRSTLSASDQQHQLRDAVKLTVPVASAATPKAHTGWHPKMICWRLTRVPPTAPTPNEITGLALHQNGA